MLPRNGAVLLSRVVLSSYKKVAFCTAIPKNPLQDFNTAAEQGDKGSVYDKKPFKMTCEAGKAYSWCCCGKSRSQPLCDGTHKSVFLKIKLKPVRFTVAKTGEYYLCNCKQTSNRPFCDGTHKQEHVQQASTRSP